jgi:SAM-dependent methyltransferase
MDKCRTAGLAEEEFKRIYEENYLSLTQSPPDGFEVFKSALYKDDGEHLHAWEDAECEYAAMMQFICGLLACYKITSLDVRHRKPVINEEVLTVDAKNTGIKANKYDAVLSLCSLEHFGLGRYGDEFDMEADTKGFAEMRRVLKPGGVIIFTTTITQNEPAIWFNAHRIYSHAQIRAFCDGMQVLDEKVISLNTKEIYDINEKNRLNGDLDFYCGCWRK